MTPASPIYPGSREKCTGYQAAVHCCRCGGLSRQGMLSLLGVNRFSILRGIADRTAFQDLLPLRNAFLLMPEHRQF